MRREGPEAPGQSWSDASARYSWGVYDVSWRRALPGSSTPRGLPLDLYIHPRSESCTYLGSKVRLDAPGPVVVHVAASGAVRLVWDGADVAANDDVHARLVLDRMAARIASASGEHLLAVKVCSAAVADEGRVRLRFTDEAGKPVTVTSSSDLRGVRAVTPPETPAQKAPPVAAKPPPDSGKGHPGKKGKGGGEAPPPVPTPALPKIVPPSGVTVVPTPLQKALDIGGQASIDRVLTAIVLRTIGGADDARSPRAPGLLDRVARAEGLSPDALAMAGWVSPFGANRSGWLNLALARARAAGDAASTAFAQRRIAAAHLGSTFADWALATALWTLAPFP